MEDTNTSQESGIMECDGINPDQDPATEGVEQESAAAVSEEAPHDDPEHKPSVQDIPLHEEDPSSTQNGSASSGGCCDHSDDEDENKMLCILQFNSSTNMATRNWLLSSLKVPEKEGGAELLVSSIQTKSNGDGDTVLQIGATRERLLEGAEKICIRKKCKDGSLREFSRGHRDHFDSGNKCFLTTCEKQRVIYYLLTNIRSTKEEDIPGTDTKKITLYPEQRIVPKMMNSGLIDGIYPLHTPTELVSLENHWYNHPDYFQRQPIEMIRDYFGEKIGIYFSFLGFYTKALFLPAAFGLLYFLLDTFVGHLPHGYAIFAIFNLFWTTVFLEFWKRKCSSKAFRWGTYGKVKFEEPRAEYHGPIGTNPVTGRREPRYPASKRFYKKYCVSAPIILVFLCLAFLMMLGFFWFEDYLKTKVDVTTTVGGLVLLVPSVLYAVVIIIVNSIYRKIASFLNDWENHRLQSAHENNLILKLVVFDFANCFMCLFFIAFYLQDMVKLRKYLSTLLIIQQFIEQFLETALPYLILRFWRGRKADDDVGKAKKDDDAPRQDVKKDVAQLVAKQSQMDHYPGTFDDYLELFLQFGYVFLFSAVFPLAAVFALLNNVIEVRSDAFKLSRVCQRPFGQAVADIGTWQITFEIMSIIAVLTNVALMALSPEIQSLFPEMSTTKYILLFVIVEHIFLAFKAAIAILIPDLPEWMEVELAKEEFESRKALAERKAAELTHQLSFNADNENGGNVKAALAQAQAAHASEAH
ncbi:anoctamin-10 isoform X1 [Strongylocentrotus purpuratus]|uniref:Anoctamin n=1 Tax=Strongylocentrotus purpuratus TaxID=7668 RepID=A0A7M7LLC9_STRPU|nr:anoctamin-10 isoform X1 [Strongylocentrotus purpuratus]|eukprot:XP_003726602.1 PREDICTED: anoctamin-10 isoform X1 [Strongylocentrotus purpuratus]